VPWWGGRLTGTLSVCGTLARPEDTAETLVARAEEELDRSTEADADRATVV
jgi:hypothetical protein